MDPALWESRLQEMFNEVSQELLTRGPGHSHIHAQIYTHTYTYMTCIHRHRHACEDIHTYLQVSYAPHSNSPTHKTFMDTFMEYTTQPHTHQLTPCNTDT